ncbi:hypothetical protein TL16_g09498 [Triparma laevis f. inornata]|uniref:DNA endonuclease activator Ctp1 C-terminal domain-containing protein n=1 Tax=Triparma laevis f. inornata TaxID=1714386 RepID=A0A9W7B809_9STRA|nr:hypothetical protein TL16_g09498 [Triparma laevis f. inornata]
MPKSSRQSPGQTINTGHSQNDAAIHAASPASLDSFLGSLTSSIKQRVEDEVTRRLSTSSQDEQLEDEVECLREEVTRVRAILDARNVEMASLRRAKNLAVSKLKKWTRTVAQWIKRTMEKEGGVIRDTPDFGDSVDTEDDGSAELLAKANAEIDNLRARLRAYENIAESEGSDTDAEIEEIEPTLTPEPKRGAPPILCEAVARTDRTSTNTRTSPGKKSGRKIVAVSSPSKNSSPSASTSVDQRKEKEKAGGSSEKKRKRADIPYTAASNTSTTSTTSTTAAPQATAPNPNPYGNNGNTKYKQVIRGKDQRRAMQGYDCEECKNFFSAICDSSNGAFDKKEMLKQCSRHKSNWVPTQTPPDFWEMGFMDEEKEGKEILTQKRSELMPMKRRK